MNGSLRDRRETAKGVKSKENEFTIGDFIYLEVSLLTPFKTTSYCTVGANLLMCQIEKPVLVKNCLNARLSMLYFCEAQNI
jgi:hypothetical protein